MAVASETIARKYAIALQRDLPPADAEKAAVALNVLAEVMAKVPALASYCADPQVPRDRKELVLQDVLQPAGAPAVAQRFVMVLLDQGEFAELPLIAKSLRAALDAQQGVQAVEIVSATPLAAPQAKKIADAVAARLNLQVRPTYSVDPSLLGGVLVRAGSRELDGSVRGRLSRIKEQLLED